MISQLKNKSVHLSLDGGTLIAVPAIHYHSAFAETVNGLCLGGKALPQAVAVELGADACSEIEKWLKEIGVSPKTKMNTRCRLPCMLGLIRNNRLVHPEFKDTALQLQEQYGTQIDATILRNRLHFSQLSLICLSPTDSIIEAIRCAIEVGIPVYGIDIEEFANHDRKPILVEDPSFDDANTLRAYVDSNARRASECRDPYVDGRREYVMAARLKYLTKKHQCVLFTGGLAHWDSLVQLLNNSDVQEAPPPPPPLETRYKRSVIDPVTAVHQMDGFPSLTTKYESCRSEEDFEDFQTKRFNISWRAIRKAYVSVAQMLFQKKSTSTETAMVEAFLQYLANLCVLYQRQAPDLFLTVTAAEAIVSHEFATHLGSELIYGSMQWIAPDSYPDLPYLRSVPFDEHERALAKANQKVQIVFPDCTEGPSFINMPDCVASTPRENLEVRSQMPIKYFEKKEPEKGAGVRSGIWPPCEYLLYGTAYQTAEWIARIMEKGKTEPFSGSMEGGIDYRATAKAMIWAAVRNDQRPSIQVRKQERSRTPEDALCDPFVYVFESDRLASTARPTWSITRAWSSFPKHVDKRYRETLDKVFNKLGDVFVAGVFYGETRAPEPELLESKLVTGLHLLWGALIFGNPCIDAVQSAKWVQEWIGDGEKYRCPIISGEWISDLAESLKERCHIDLELSNWKETLIRIAIPFARQRVIVTAADNSCITSRVRIEAKRRNIKIVYIPLSDFSAERIENIRKRYHAYPLDQSATKWSNTLENLLGQKSDAYSDLVPLKIRMQSQNNA